MRCIPNHVFSPSLPCNLTREHASEGSLTSPTPACSGSAMNLSIPHLTHLQNEEITACATPSVGSWGSWNYALKTKLTVQVPGRQDAGAEEKRVVFSNPASFLCSGFRIEQRTGEFFWYKSNYQARHKNKLTDNLSVKLGHNCYVRLLFLLFVSRDLRSYINALIEILVIINMY